MPAASVDPLTDDILDAALAVFEDVGIRRSTIDDIARRAGIKRVTVYRRMGSKDDVVRAVVLRESQRIIAAVAERANATGTLEDRIAATFTGLVLALRDHPLYNRMLRLEPDTTLPRITIDAAEPLTWAIHAAVMILGPDLPDHLADTDLLTERVEIIARTIHSLILTPKAVTDLHTEAQLTRFAHRHITPLLNASLPATQP
ncbi:TetR/AcrR family transcriptional regulator [Nocardia arthritidis]|uniref:TetR family transcriptional regulator n=1 Tax=Nocardia arthritidis TaxID=228602 RepID=A0A6G9YQQ2_9NOCA|nr:TetR/AcrR family transcriptional regulator [Nocardia arthritidis]QIS15532.1 TetR family transcriptional regulator [Nocardia arthritidis]